MSDRYEKLLDKIEIFKFEVRKNRNAILDIRDMVYRLSYHTGSFSQILRKREAA